MITLRDSTVWYKKYFVKLYPFICAFILMCIYLIPQDTMCSISGDAADIWETIKSFGNKDMHGSYVLYKGILSIYPYIWLFKLAVLLHVNEWLFIKLFYCFTFAYITSIALPDTYELLSGNNTVHYRRLIITFVCFYLWRYNNALSQMMVDLPCLMFFLFLVNAALRVYHYGMDWKKCLCIGLGLGLNLGGSGQYTMPALCICIFLVLVLIKHLSKKRGNTGIQLWGNIQNLMLIAFPAVVIKVYNSYFLNIFVEGLRQNGAWIPSNMDWLAISFSRFMNKYRVNGGIDIPSNLNQAIFQKHLGIEAFGQMQEVILSGGYGMNMLEYIKLVLHNPISFCFCYLEKLFIVLSPDGGSFRFLPLFIFYTALFITILIIVSKCKLWRNILNVKFWIVFSFFWAVVPVFIGCVELRCAMQIQGLILAVALCDPYIWKRGRQIYKSIKNRNWKKKQEIQIPYVFLLYCAFMIMCFLHMSSLYELVGVNADEIMLKFR